MSEFDFQPVPCRISGSGMRSSPKTKSREESLSFIGSTQKKGTEKAQDMGNEGLKLPQELAKVPEIVQQKPAKTLLSLKNTGKAFLIVFI